MIGLIITLLSIVGMLLLVALVYLLLIVRPAARTPKNEKLLCDYAHRGLHKGNKEGTAPENSLAAFELACQAGFGIELDVQLSSDGTVMVFHDDTLIRMTGKEGRVCDFTAEELGKMKLADSEETIPTFREVLKLVDGRVPLLVELKGESLDKSLCPKVAEMLKEYGGDYCIESFNPLLVGEMKKLLPDAFCGLLYTNVCEEKKKSTAKNIAVTLMLLNFIAKPDFISYNQVYRESLQVKLTTRFYHAPKFVWTTRGQEEIDTAHKCGECPIFEILD